MRYKFSTYEVKVQRLNESGGSFRVDTPDQTAAYWREKVVRSPWYDPEREQIVSLVLNTRLAAIGHSLVSLGTINESVCHPREVFRAAVAMGAYAVALMHNHPSGNPTPSQADQSVTRTIAEAGKILQIGLVDHVIVGQSSPACPNGYFSFRQAGII